MYELIKLNKMKNLEELNLVPLDAAELQEIQGGNITLDDVKKGVEIVKETITTIIKGIYPLIGLF